MSLVYDALKQQADPAQPVPVLPRASWWGRQSPRHRGGMLLAAGAVVAAPLVLLAASALDRVQPEAMSVATTPVAALESEHDIVAVDTGVPAEVASATPAARTPPATLETSIPDAAASTAGTAGSVPDAMAHAGVQGAAVAAMAAPTPAPPPAEPASAPTSAPTVVATASPAPASSAASAASAASPPINITVAQRASDRDATDEVAIAQAVRAIEAAVAAGEATTARDALGTLEILLHADSLTLLRMQAWVAHGSQDMAGAEQLYRRIAERMPDDLNAGVNIALLDARRGELASARGRLQRLTGRHGRSPMLAQAMAELDGYAQ